MNDQTQPYCAHSRVVLKYVDYPGGTKSCYWECDSGCGARFYPERVDQSRIALRRKFAGLAMQGILASDQTEDLKENVVVQASVAYADALLKELEKPV